MSFSYSAGTTSPGFGGLAEFTSLRLNDGTFRPLDIPPLNQTAPIRFVANPIPRGGSKMSIPRFDGWQFDITGFFDVVDPNDVQAAKDYLFAQINLAKASMGLTLNAKGWSAARTMTVQVAGPVVVTEPDVSQKKTPRRQFTIPLFAEDPIQYSLAQATTAITTTTTVTNNGTANVPHVVHFDGANTTFVQVAQDLGGAKVRLDYALAAGKYAEINTRDGSIITNTGVDLYQYVTIDDGARYLPPGGGFSTWSFSSGGGGAASIKHYDGWA